MIRGVLAHCTVTDLERAEDWYTRLLGRGPDARPMPGLLEWRLGEGFGMQVWSEPDRAGDSCAVLEIVDLDATAARLTAAGLEHDGPQPGGGARILQLTDPDGNRIVLTGD
ncbi:VOC family protein [Pseudactinotalea suaedae]|uniref:VOC family protein n=1 Tax=Pseudactinotalea suaedae TaxID=1524924 RepID=UPI0012E1A710|nr:VOC family protein [Pseudactinotalea suaedae]